MHNSMQRNNSFVMCCFPPAFPIGFPDILGLKICSSRWSKPPIQGLAAPQTKLTS